MANPVFFDIARDCEPALGEFLKGEIPQKPSGFPEGFCGE
jgi:hypothetical protein